MNKDIRTDLRQGMLIPAKIEFNDRQSVFDCVVKNISSGGARLRVASRLGVPNRFTLVIPRFGQRQSCRVAWGTMTEIGVSFAPLPQGAGKPESRLVKD